MKRIIMHWTGGTYQPNATDKKHYHKLIDGNGKVHDGKYPIAANEKIDGGYAAHTRGCNTGSIGIAVCAMAGAKESPLHVGKYPVTDKQIDALAAEVARLCIEYGIEVKPQTVLTHAEVESMLSIKQRAKWDITVIGGKKLPQWKAGDMLRHEVRCHIRELTPKPNPWAAIIAAILRMFKK